MTISECLIRLALINKIVFLLNYLVVSRQSVVLCLDSVMDREGLETNWQCFSSDKCNYDGRWWILSLTLTVTSFYHRTREKSSEIVQTKSVGCHIM